MPEHSQNIWQCHRYRKNLAVSCTGHQVSQIKATFDPFCTIDEGFNANFFPNPQTFGFNFLHPFSFIFCPICSRGNGDKWGWQYFFKGGGGLIWAIWDGGRIGLVQKKNLQASGLQMNVSLTLYNTKSRNTESTAQIAFI